MKLNFCKIACALFLTLVSEEMVHGKEKPPGKPGLEIVPGKNARQIACITGDSLFVISGKTQLFTVDTPEGERVISTCPGADQLTSEIRSTNGTALTYRIFGVRGNEKHAEKIESGDKLQITAQDGLQAIKHIAVRQMALCGSLSLLQSQITRGSTRDLYIQFHAGQRTPNATVEFTIPAGFFFSQENVLVNIIGRGFVKLKDLPNQSIGRVGSDYS